MVTGVGLQEKVAVVTGGSHGIGLAVVSALAALGARVVTAARSSSPALDELIDSRLAAFVPADLTTSSGVAALVEAAGDPIDVVVTNVGLSTPRPGGFLEITDEQWWSSLDLNLMASVRAIRAALPHMHSGGSIVAVTSDNARLPDPHLVDYGAAKAALSASIKALSAELAPRGIRVNAVSPGPVDTRRWTSNSAKQAAAARMPTRRLTTPAEVAAAVAMLSGPASGNTTGSTWTVDGGLLPTL